MHVNCWHYCSFFFNSSKAEHFKLQERLLHPVGDQELVPPTSIFLFYFFLPSPLNRAPMNWAEKSTVQCMTHFLGLSLFKELKVL